MATKKKTATPEQASAEGLISLSLKDNATGERSSAMPDTALKAEILDSMQVLKKGLISLQVKDIDRKAGQCFISLSIRKDYSQELINQHIDKYHTRRAIAQVYGFLDVFEKREAPPQRPQHIKTGKHLVSQYLGPVDPQTKLNFAETLDRYTRETGLTMGNRPLGWGLNLDEYQGQITLPKEEVLTDPERGPNYLPAKVKSMGPEAMARKAYKHIPELPTIRLNLAEIVKLAGFNHDRQGDKEKVKQAVRHH